jgi:RNA polymerase sigma-70 factor (ECF subfamily)
VRAYQYLHQFAGRSPFSSWLTRIAVHEALARLRLRKRSQQMEDAGDGEIFMTMVEPSPDPEQSASGAELGRMLEDAVLHLPEQFRTVVMLRDVEELSTSETAAALDLTQENVKVRLHRGHAKLRLADCPSGNSGEKCFSLYGRPLRSCGLRRLPAACAIEREPTAE